MSESGLRSTIGNRVCAKSVPGVRIPISPPGNFKVVLFERPFLQILIKKPQLYRTGFAKKPFAIGFEEKPYVKGFDNIEVLLDFNEEKFNAMDFDK